MFPKKHICLADIVAVKMEEKESVSPHSRVIRGVCVLLHKHQEPQVVAVNWYTCRISPDDSPIPPACTYTPFQGNNDLCLGLASELPNLTKKRFCYRQGLSVIPSPTMRDR